MTDKKTEALAFPKTPEQISDFIGSDYLWREHKVSDVVPHEDDKYCVSAHDLISAFARLAEQPAQQEEPLIDRVANKLCGNIEVSLPTILPPQPPTESVSVNGVAYTVPAQVAAEMLRLHLEIKSARQEFVCSTGLCYYKAQQEPVALGALAKRRIFDYIRGAYDLGYSDARNAQAVPGDNAPGYKGRDVEADHGGALLHALEAITSPQPSKPDFKAFKEWAEAAGYDTAHTHDGIKWVCLNPMTADLWKAWQAAHGIKETP